MREAKLTCRRKRRTVHTTDSKHSSQVYPNLVKGLQVEVPIGLIHHDRGRQYCSNVNVEQLLSVGAIISMSTPGLPTENAFAESFIKTVKCEEVYVHQYHTLEDAQARLQTFLEDV